MLTQQREINSANKNAIARIEYAAENDDFQTVVDELQIYQDNSQAFKDTVSNVKKSVSKTPKLNIELDDNLFNSLLRTGLHKHPYIEKGALKAGMLYQAVKMMLMMLINYGMYQPITLKKAVNILKKMDIR